MQQLLSASLLLAVLALGGCQQPAPPTAQQPAPPCIDESKIRGAAACTMQYDPVCGCNTKTYSNACVATNAGVTSYTKGACPSH
ncbi:Kazal-type serine protease inhibitor family protein [Hymenobacter weizhouensis]|uniref:kazal domain protein n=1 Tax=Hymenobacter sp. YIM 151500-1 TaxID=2987689 RepID=UPI002226F0CB|nr:kazal domain protein [Hymenobacter sp. YIM 151500-1]UYZ65131.1 kazal domain protein [Hymenobacter sp. YIM 151500-1]